MEASSSAIEPWNEAEKVLKMIDGVMEAGKQLPSEQRTAVAEHMGNMAMLLAEEDNQVKE